MSPGRGRRWYELAYSAQAALLCGDPRFREWIEAESVFEAAIFVRAHCGVKSRRELDTDEAAAARWVALQIEYRAARNGKSDIPPPDRNPYDDF